jgi:hypothetical protein
MTATSSPVGPASGGPDRQRYLVGSTDPALVDRVATVIGRDPLVRVDRTLDTASGGGILVIETTPDRAQRLRDEYGPALVIEEDRELGLS